tara:strand:+ start:2336 stop:3667 length:1332 start_codon:yes stop_codon:yes gene_type:complete
MSNTWDKEDEYDEEYGEANGFGAVADSNSTANLPQGVTDRLDKYAERTNKKLADAITEFLGDIKDNYACDDPSQEDDDLLVDWAEQFILETRKQSSGSNSKLQTWVGCFLGMHDKKSDRLANIVRANLKLYKDDPNEAVSSGRLGVFEKEGNVWALHHKEGKTVLDASAEGTPPYGIKAGNEWVCLTTYDNQPAPSTKMGRYAYFLGGEEQDFVKNGSISMWRVDLTQEHIYHNLDIGRPCKIQVVPPRDNASDAFKDVLGIYSNFEVEYTDEFVSENLRPLLQPAKYWTNSEFHDLYVSIDSLEEAYEERKQFYTSGGEKRQFGPLVITRAIVSSLNTEPRDSEYDSEGENYLMVLNSPIAGDVTCWIPGAVGKTCSPFRAHWGEESFPYAEKSTVFVFGRIGMATRDGLTSPKMTVYGIYGHPRRCRRRETGGDTGVGQFD